ncbi:uncharacterized protein K452DRAFT_322795 [Aplosporella prunicola CBS 121167]|uniref:Uncharacterized protein n=1 Tax=Aplosporella prunicola CBS 121167 TaxID=1176127 RepID=A0A6A6AZH4_9PEZI|nr:uncharacterized protein K452DRAFT_322795 [Aplosporella prunicola CBS 121167]KAF2135871.1 hypothetical protein K452DRAFT_322795 [Aplosporella prunicola CBS 121167]
MPAANPKKGSVHSPPGYINMSFPTEMRSPVNTSLPTPESLVDFPSSRDNRLTSDMEQHDVGLGSPVVDLTTPPAQEHHSSHGRPSVEPSAQTQQTLDLQQQVLPRRRGTIRVARWNGVLGHGYVEEVEVEFDEYNNPVRRIENNLGFMEESQCNFATGPQTNVPFRQPTCPQLGNQPNCQLDAQSNPLPNYEPKYQPNYQSTLSPDSQQLPNTWPAKPNPFFDDPQGLAALETEEQPAAHSKHSPSELALYPEHSQSAPGPQPADEAAQYENDGRFGQWPRPPMHAETFSKPEGVLRFWGECIDPRLLNAN